MGGKGGLKDQILRLIARDEHLGQRHHLRARRPALPPSLQRQRDVGLNRPNRGVQLGKGQAKGLGHGDNPFGHIKGFSRFAARGKVRPPQALP